MIRYIIGTGYRSNNNYLYYLIPLGILIPLLAAVATATFIVINHESTITHIGRWHIRANTG